MPHRNSFREKREEQHNAHNRKAGLAKFKRNLTHRRRRRNNNRLYKEWVEERELDQSSRKSRDNRLNSRERTES